MKKLISVLLVIAMLVPMLCVDVFAQDHPVNDFVGLKQAISDAADGDVITVNDDITITQTLMITKNTTIKSDGAKTLTAGPLKMDSIEECNMFYVSGGKELSLDNITLDGANEARLIRAKGAKLNLTNVIMKNGSTEKVEKNSQTDQVYSGGAIYAEEGSIVTIKGGSFENNNTGTRPLDAGRAAEGGAIKLYQSELYINDAQTTAKDTTKFIGNHLDDWQTAGGRQGGAIEATDSKVEIYGTTFNIPGPFNTGGAIKFESCNSALVKNSYFEIEANKGEFGVAGGAITSEGSDLNIENSNFKAGDKTRVAEAGGLIQVVGSGKFNLTESTLEGSGAWWNGGKYTANTGGAISFYDESTVTANITDTTIKNFMADGNGAGIALSKGNGHKSSVNLTLKNTTIQNAAVYTWQANSYGGCMYIGEGNTVKIDGGTISGQTTSNVAAGIYNMGDLEITGGAKVAGNTAYQMVGGIYHGGTRLKIDEATISGNQKGDNSTGHNHFIDGKEKSGINIYADKDVIITPKATIDGNDVRVFDGVSSILLTGALTNKINVSISEKEKTTNSTNANIKVFEEDKHRKVGYVVAKGTDGYTPTADDAKKLYYVTNDTTQAVTTDKENPGFGKWDFVLNPETKQVVLGQRVKLVYHGNKGKIGESDSESKPVTVYKNTDFWKEQLEDFKVADAKRDKWSFMGWYHWIDDVNEVAENNTDSIQELKNPSSISDKLFDFSRVKFSNNNKDEIVNILTPNVINTYAGWSENIDLEATKDWKKADGKEALDDKDKVEVKITLKGGEEDKTLTLNSANEFKGKFENLPVFTKSYDPADKEINMNLKFTPKEYKAEEEKLEGFTTTYAPATVTANSEDSKKITITNKKEEPKNYKVTYEFITASTGRLLPEKVTSQIPADESGKANGEEVSPNRKELNDVEDSDGTWKFKGWIKKAGKEDATNLDLDSGVAKSSDESLKRRIDGADVKYVGVWVYEPKPVIPDMVHRVIYEFKSGIDGKELPTDKNFTDLLPKDSHQYNDGETVTAKAPAQASYKDTDGTWTFTGWDKKTDTIKGADVTFTGYWTFAAKPTPEPTSDFTITKSVDKAYYEKAGEELTYTITVTNTGKADLKGLKLSDSLVKDEELKKLGLETTFNLDVNASEKFTYTYIVTADDVRAREVNNTATVTHGKDSKTATAKSILKTRRGDVYVRYETEDGKILDEFAVELGAPIDTYYYTEEKAFPGYRYIGLAPYSDPPEGRVIEGTLYVVYLYRERPGRTPDRRRDRYEREEKEEVEPITEAKRKPELNKKDHKQYMYGYPDWTFVPEANITRGEAAAMFARLFKEYPGLDYDFKKYYTDVERTYWGFKEISYLSEFGILSGYSDGTFRPNNKITRAEFVKIAESFEALMWGLSPYKDVDGGHWAFRYIVSSAAKGWINGYLDGTFRPDSYITRAEAVTIVNRLLERHPDKDYIDTHKTELKPFTDLKPSYWAYYEIYEAVEGHFYNRGLRDADEHWWRLTDERFVFSLPRYNY